MAGEIAIEDEVFDFLEEKIAEAGEGDELFEAELHDHLYSKISAQPGYGIRVGDCESVLAPNPGSTEMEEFDADLTLVVFARVTGAERAKRKEARTKVLLLSKAVAMLFVEDPTLGGRVNDGRVMRCLRGWDNISGVPYAVVNMPLLVNDSGVS